MQYPSQPFKLFSNEQKVDFPNRELKYNHFWRKIDMFPYAYLTIENLLIQPTKASFENKLQPHVFLPA